MSPTEALGCTERIALDVFRKTQRDLADGRAEQAVKHLHTAFAALYELAWGLGRADAAANALPLPKFEDGAPLVLGDTVRFDGRDLAVMSVEWIQHPGRGHVKVVRFWDPARKREHRRNWTEMFDYELQRGTA